MNYGGFWIRFIAYTVDSLILFIGLVGVALLLGLMGLSLAGGPIIFLAVTFLYFAVLQSSSRQATFGKALVGLKVTDLNGGRISFLRSLARTAATLVSNFTLMIGYLLAAFTSRKQALHDMIASTLVVRETPGRVGLAVAVAVLAPVVMVGAVVMFAGAMVAGLAGGMAAGLLDAPKPAPVQVAKSAPAPKPAAPAKTVVVATAAPAAQVAVSAPAAAPAPVAKASEPPPAAIPVKEIPSPQAKMEAKEEAKGEAKEAAKEEPVVMTTGPGAVDLSPKTTAAPAAAPAVALVPKSMMGGPVVAGPKFNDLTTAVLYRDAAAVNDLINFGKWADKADSHGTTPLMLAVSLGDASIAEALLKAGANASRALPIARERKNAGMASLLEKYGAR